MRSSVALLAITVDSLVDKVKKLSTSVLINAEYDQESERLIFTFADKNTIKIDFKFPSFDSETIKTELIKYIDSTLQKDKTGIDEQAILSKLKEELAILAKDIKSGKDGADGKNADEGKILSELQKQLETLVEKGINEVIKKDQILSELKQELDILVSKIEVRHGVDGKSVDENKVQEFLKTELNKLTSIIDKKLKSVKDGVDGKDADEEAIKSQLTLYIEKSLSEIKKNLADNINVKDGIDGKDGKDADEERIKLSVIAKVGYEVQIYKQELEKLINKKLKKAELAIQKSIPKVIHGIDGKDGQSIKGDKGDKGEDGKSIKGDKGERGNGIKDVEINTKDELIVTTDDKVINAGKISVKKFFGGGGDISYTNSLPMPFDVGGLPKDTRFKNVQLKNLLTKLLYGVDLPYFKSFFLKDVTPNPKDIENLEIGATFTTQELTASFEIVNALLLEEKTIVINQDDQVLVEGLDNVSPVKINTIQTQSDVIKTMNFAIYAYDTTGTTFQKSIPISFWYRVYWGAYSDDIKDIIGVGGTNPLKKVFAPNLTLGNQGGTQLCSAINGEEYLFKDLTKELALIGAYRWFCYPAILGENYIFYELETDIALVFSDRQELEITNDHGLKILYFCWCTENEIFNEFIMKVKNG